MKKLLLSIFVAMLAACTIIGFTSCSGGGKGGQSNQAGTNTAPVISNKPTDNTLTITADTNTYQFEIAEYDGDVTWISTVKSVATISENGLLTMLGAGYTEVIVKDTDSNRSDSVALTIVDGRTAETLTITGLPETVRAGDAPLQLGVTSSVGGEVSVIYSSSNPNVATVSETGLFTPVAKGITTVTATKTGTNIKTSVQVEVLGAEIASIEFVNLPKYGMLVGNTYPLSAVCEPDDCENYELEWSVDNTDVAVLDDLGNLIALAKGECTLTARIKGTDIKAEKVITVSELSKTSENFRFATVGTSNVMSVGPTITFTNVDGEIVEYGKDQALKIYTRGNGAYNCFTVNFGELEAGNYKLSMLYKVVEGRHSGAMVKDSDTSEFGYVMATTALGGDRYCFYFNQETAGTKKFAFSAQQWETTGAVLVDDIVLEKIDEIPQGKAAGKIDDATFDRVTYIEGQSCDINGVYVTPRKLAAELVNDGKGGKALKVTRVEGGYAYVALSFGDIVPGNYTLKLDIENNDYQAILQVLQITNANGLWKAPTLQDIKYGEMDTIFEQAEVNGNTYTLSFSVSESYENFALALSTNLAENAGESIIIDNVSFEKAPDETTIDFENQPLGVVSKVAGAGNVDFGKGLVVTSAEITEQGYVTENGNTYYSVTFKGWNTYSLINLGTLSKGRYVINMDAKLLKGTMKGRFIVRINGAQKDLVENVDYTKSGDRYTFNVDLEETTTEFCIGYRSVANDNANFTLAYDNISVTKYVAPEGVEIITYPTSELEKGETFTFNAKVLPAECVGAALVWSVDNENVGSIDQNGKFTAKGAGQCTVTVTVADTEITASKTVTVKITPPRSVSISVAPQAAIAKGSTFEFVASVLPENSEGYTLVWSVDDDTVGVIDEQGRFTAKAVGECTVTVTVADTEITASVKVVVDSSMLPPNEGGDAEGTAPDGYDEWVDSILNG